MLPPPSRSRRHRAALRLRDPTRDREPQPGAADVRLPTSTIERLEDSLALIHRHARSAIRNVEGEPTPLAARRQIYRRGWRRIFRGILDEIHECTQRLREIEPAEQQRPVRRHVNLQLTPLKPAGDLLCRRAEKILRFVGLHVGDRDARRDPREIENLRDETIEAIGLFLDHIRALVPT